MLNFNLKDAVSPFWYYGNYFFLKLFENIQITKNLTYF